MKYLKLFENNEDDEDLILIEEFLLEYFEKWKLCEQSKYSDIQYYDRQNYNGTFEIKKLSTKYFKVSGFTTDESGYRVKISFTKAFDENEFKKDMTKYIKRVCVSGYKYETYKDVYGIGSTGTIGVETFYIAFFK